jgi:hypothetical protein
MAYTKTTWQDEVLSGAERFEILDNAGAAVDAWADLANCQIQLATSVTTSGTALDATHLNNIEDGIEDLATGAARSVKGVAGAAAGDVDDIEAGTDGYVLRRSGTSIGFGQIAIGAIPNDLITNAKLADPYDVLHVIALDDDEDVEIANDLISFPVADVHNGKSVVRLMAWLSGGASSSGDVTVRFYNVTDSVVIGTVTITAGNRIGNTTSITNAALATNDIIRIDITAEGTGALGLQVQIKVDKS